MTTLSPAPVFATSTDADYRVLKSFGFDAGSEPQSRLIEGMDGAFYGTTRGGGAGDRGTVFRISADGSSYSVLHTFDGHEGWGPGGLTQTSDGTLYGTTTGSAASEHGRVFKIAADGSGFTILHAFNGADGTSPGALVRGLDGAFYGTTGLGGPDDLGTIFRISADGSEFTTLRNFSRIDHVGPYGSALIQGSDGGLYGTTYASGQSGLGAVFKVSTDGSAFAVIHQFDGANGSNPASPLIESSDGSLYGLTAYGGASNVGTLFRMSLDGSFFSVIHVFDGTSGSYPLGGLAEGPDGALYGTTAYGGASNAGTLFRVSSDRTSFLLLREFNNSDGANPSDGSVVGTDGLLYGVAAHGGLEGLGTVFSVATDGSSFAIIHSYAADGNGLASALVQSSDGTLYGTTLYGSGSNGWGKVFKLSTDGSEFSALQGFDGTTTAFPYNSALVQGTDGAFYGTTSCVGGGHWGTVYRIAADGSALSVVHEFERSEGICLSAGLAFGSDGALYGTTFFGGAHEAGTVFRVATDGSSFSVLHSFEPSTDGGTSYTALMQGLDGAFYGTTNVGIFRITADGSSFSLIHAFDDEANGGFGQPLVQGSDGKLYGTTQYGGLGYGVAFRVLPDGSAFSILHSFNETDGAQPTGVVMGSDGALYGTTFAGGAYGAGVAYRMSLDGFVSVLHSFDVTNGGHPLAGLIQGSDGAFYGTANDGEGGSGVVFRLALGSLEFGAAQYRVASTAGKAWITVVRSGSVKGTSTVAFATADGTAKEGVNYGASSGVLTFDQGVRSRSFAVPILGNEVDGASLLLVKLTGPSKGTTLGNRSTAVLRIIGQTLSFTTATYRVSHAARKAIIAVRRTGSAASEATVEYATSDGTATDGTEYAATSGRLTFAPGVWLQRFEVPVNKVTDQVGETTVGLRLSNPGPGVALAGVGTATLHILNPTVAGHVQFTAAVQAVKATDGVAIIKVTRAGGTASGVTVAFASSDGTATAADYTATAGTLSFGAGVLTQSFTVPISTNTAKGDKTVRLTLSNPSGGATLGRTVATVLTIQTGAPQAFFAASVFRVGEAAKQATIVVRRTGSLTGPAQVTFTASDGTATAADGDYTPTSGVLSFAPGVASRSFAVGVLRDSTVEADETVNLTLSSPSPASLFLGSPQTAQLVIATDQAILSFSSPAFTVSEVTKTARVRVRRLGSTTSAVSVAFATSDGTAHEGTNYASTSGTLLFPAGVASLNAIIPVLHDTREQGPRTVNLSLVDPQQGAILGTPASAILTIRDADSAGTLAFSASTFSAGANDAEATITVRRIGGKAGEVSVDYSTADGTAVDGVDYVGDYGTLWFGYGETSKTLKIRTLSFSGGGAAKSVHLALRSPTGAAQLGAQDTATLWIVED